MPDLRTRIRGWMPWRVLRSPVVVVALVNVAVLVAAVSALGSNVVGSNVSVGSPSNNTPQNHQNEPAVAMDASHPNVLVAGWNDLVDFRPCPQDLAQRFGTCLQASGSSGGAGFSAVSFSFDGGKSWIRPSYTGWTAADCDPTSTCSAHFGTIHTLPWYYESTLVSAGDPAVAIGPVPVNGTFSWANGSRVYFANLMVSWPSGLLYPFPNPEFHGYAAVGVSRLDNPTPTSVLAKSNWKPPVLVNATTGQTAFEDKDQIWADNAASSPYFGRVYVCNAEFRSNGNHLGGNAPGPLTFSFSGDGGSTWSTKQVTPAGDGSSDVFGLTGCSVRSDSHGAVYLFAEMFENRRLVSLPTHGFHVVFKSTDGGKSFTKAQIVRQITDPCFFVDPVDGRCVLDGFGGARTDLSAAPSVDIANGAPTGAGATNEIVDAWSDGGVDVNAGTGQLSWSLDGGTTWSGPMTVSLAGDRPLYSAAAISPTGDRMYVVYEAAAAPWRGSDMTSPRPYHGVFRTAPVGVTGAPDTWADVYNGSTDTSAGHNDLRGTYPGHDMYQERVGDYVYAAASRSYGVGVWTDAQNATVCDPVQRYRAASLAAGTRALPAPWPLADCPDTFGNTDIWSVTTSP
jgi:hypothetical protein